MTRVAVVTLLVVSHLVTILCLNRKHRPKACLDGAVQAETTRVTLLASRLSRTAINSSKLFHAVVKYSRHRPAHTKPARGCDCRPHSSTPRLSGHSDIHVMR